MSRSTENGPFIRDKAVLYCRISNDTIRHRLEAYVTLGIHSLTVIKRNLQSFFRKQFIGHLRLSAGSSELQSSAVGDSNFSTTDYCCAHSSTLALSDTKNIFSDDMPQTLLLKRVYNQSRNTKLLPRGNILVMI